MSEVINYSNLKLFNLVEYGYSKSIISKIVSFIGNNKASEHLINLAIGYTPTSKRIINDICKIDTSYYSVYCLIYFGINDKACERIKQFYSSLNILSLKINELSIKVKLQKPTLQKILYAVNQLSNFIKTDREKIIDEFNYGPLQVLVTNPATLAESVSLHKSCHDAHYLELNYNLYQFLQSKDRIHRLGIKDNEKTNYYIYLNYYDDKMTKSKDLEIYKALKRKEELMKKSIEKGNFVFGEVDNMEFE